MDTETQIQTDGHRNTYIDRQTQIHTDRLTDIDGDTQTDATIYIQKHNLILAFKHIETDR